MIETAIQEKSLSLFDIERGLHELMDAWQGAETPEAIAAAEQAIQAYAAAEVRKVDGIRRYLRACEDAIASAKAEAKYQGLRAKAWEARRDRLKDVTFQIMLSFGVKKIEGKTGSLHVKGNGGILPLDIVSSDLIPADLQDVTITMPESLWENFSDRVRVNLKNNPAALAEFSLMQVSKPAPNGGRIRAVLESVCDHCKGEKLVPCSHTGAADEDLKCPDCDDNGLTDCGACGGSGKHGVPGARLGDRGQHLEVK